MQHAERGVHRYLMARIAQKSCQKHRFLRVAQTIAKYHRVKGKEVEKRRKNAENRCWPYRGMHAYNEVKYGRNRIASAAAIRSGYALCVSCQ